LPQTILHFRPDLRRVAFPCKAFRLRIRHRTQSSISLYPSQVCARKRACWSRRQSVPGVASWRWCSPACQGPCTAAC